MPKVILIPGDGIGPEITEAMRLCVEATGVDMEWEVREAGKKMISQVGTPLPPETVEAVRRNQVAIKGPIVTPIGTGFRSVNVALRKQLDLYACVRPAKSYRGVRSLYRDLDLVVVRENTEDLYAGIEFAEGSSEGKKLIKAVKEWAGQDIRSDSGISLKPISRFASGRVVRFACELALREGRNKVTIVHKANIMKHSDGLFLETARKVGAEYEGRLQIEDRVVDNMAMQLVQKPELYDVLVLPNLYGDIISDLAAGLVGGLGVAPGANVGDACALFEPVHGAAPKYAGKNRANPTAMILSGVLMLRHLGEREAAERLEHAVAEVIAEGKEVTYDMKPHRDDPSAVGTREMGEAIARQVKG